MSEPTNSETVKPYFRGLDFIEAKRVAAGDGLLLVLDQKAK